jgi:ATPase family associated with various cellular activities (AAA)
VRREPSLTLQGALTILGHHEPGLITKLDNLLGGVILAAGAGAGLATVGPAALAPLSALAAVWTWVEQKNEAIRLLRQATDAASSKLIGSPGYERRQLIAAAHTAIVIAAFFDSVREHLGRGTFDKLKITNAEKEMLLTDGWRKWGEPLIDSLYSAEIPAPSPTGGFVENVEILKLCMRQIGDRFESFIRGLWVEEEIKIDWQPVLDGAAERYRTYYLKLAATVPEFMIWAMLGEHASTRVRINDLRDDMVAALKASQQALGRVEALLALQSGNLQEVTDLRLVVERANRGVLEQPIVPMDAERYGLSVEFPKVSRIYINPRYRIEQANDDARPADERWWEEKPPHHDLDMTLTGYVMAPDATRFPLLLLGHPGAGKSLLTKIIAARLPSSVYTVVRVPLRQVGANAPIIDQVQQALDLATHRRVDWWKLVEQGPGTIRVVLLDGLDELLQASSHDRSGYLQDVMEFQRVEAEQGRPVVVVVTSRTVVADRVDIPSGTTVIKLDYFNRTDIANWLRHWNEANASLIASGKVRGLSPAAALRQPELARQPLLLLMLALYSADPAFPALDADLSTANLYQRLLDNFARREVAKKADHRLSPDETERRTRDQLDRLAIAALAMFNRKSQEISEVEPGADMTVLNENLLTPVSPAELGQRLIGEFFFVHAAEAKPLSAAGNAADPSVSVVRQGERAQRSYEFLHATFGEYLVASRVLNELVDVGETALAGRRGPRVPDDDLLFALLSHQPLAGRRSTLNFAVELFANLSRSERSHSLAVLETLIDSYRHRHISDRYATYRPTPLDRVRQLAAYSANLVTLRVALEPGSAMVPLSQILPDAEEPLHTGLRRVPGLPVLSEMNVVEQSCPVVSTSTPR